jgi:hypothetical protein
MDLITALLCITQKLAKGRQIGEVSASSEVHDVPVVGEGATDDVAGMNMLSLYEIGGSLLGAVKNLDETRVADDKAGGDVD